MIISHIECSCFIILLTGHVALVATTGTTKCVPYRLAKSLRSPFLDRVPVGFLYNGTRSSCGIKWWLGCCAVLLITGVRSQQVWWYVDRVSAMATKWHPLISGFFVGTKKSLEFCHISDWMFAIFPFYFYRTFRLCTHEGAVAFIDKH